MRWRIWLSRRFIDDWLGDYAYFRSQFSRRPIDNPDQRIQQDIDIFTAGVGGEPNNPAHTSDHLLLFGAVEAVVSVFSFGSDPLAALGAVDTGYLHPPQGPVLGRHLLRARGHRHRVRHRQAADPVELHERTSQRRLPVRTRPVEGRERRRRPCTGARTPNAKCSTAVCPPSWTTTAIGGTGWCCSRAGTCR